MRRRVRVAATSRASARLRATQRTPHPQDGPHRAGGSLWAPAWAHLAAHACAGEAVDLAAALAPRPQVEVHREVADADLLADGDLVQRPHAHVGATRAAVVRVVDARRVRQALVVHARGVLVQRRAADAALALQCLSCVDPSCAHRSARRAAAAWR